MTKRKLLFSLLVFLVYAALVWFGAAFFLSGTPLALVVFVMIAVGLTVLIVYLLISRMHAPPAAAEPAAERREDGAKAAVRAPGDREMAAIEALLAEANNRLARSPKLASRRAKTTVTSLPLFLLGGGEGSGKTSTFLKSGFEPELLAGQVFRDSHVVPTQLANFWYAEDCLFAELSGSVFSGDASRWSAALKKLQGRSAAGFLKRLFGGRSEAQLRGFVLFCDTAPFLGVPDPTRLSGLSRRIQERLRLVGERFGTNFPVYVVFTKADNIPYFPEFFSRLVDNEDQQILGCSLEAATAAARPAGEVFAEAETARLTDAFNRLYSSLAERRLDMLARETNPAARPAVYEFPRELKRIRDTVVQFLVDVFRPDPLQPGPILRGFYFTGTRQVTVSALSPAAGEPMTRSAGEATSLFNLAEYQKRMGLVESASPLETSVQRWCFVSELFHRVILPDPMGQAVAFASRRQAMYRRIAFGGACALGLMVCLLWVRSWWLNADLVSDVDAAARSSYAYQPSARAIPSLDTLRGMETLREELATLLDYHRKGAPWRMRWGLYAGDRLLPGTYNLYFSRFRQVFFDETYGAIAATLLHLPASAEDQDPYDATYDKLKAYRMITQCNCAPNPAFLAPVMASVWLNGRDLDPERRELALKQIQFYSDELKQENPYKLEENKEALARGRAYLSSFGGVERLYRGIIEEANKAPRAAARLGDLAPNFKQVLNTPGEVAAAFTREGSGFVMAAIKDPSRMTLGEPCVLGGVNAGAQLLQGVQVQSDLQNLYVQDYIQHWKTFLASTSVDSFRNAADAAKRLEILADNRSPLLSAVFLISDNTNFQSAGAPSQVTAMADKMADKLVPASAKRAASMANDAAKAVMTPARSLADIGRVFQPTREVVSPNNRDRLIDEPNRAYMNALADLQRAMQRLQDDRPNNPDLSLHEAARRATDAGMDAVRQIAQRFNIAASEGVDENLKRLLESPFRESLKFIITDPSKAGRDRANAALRQFCSRLMPLERKFPFNPASDTDATLDEVAAIFAPQTGALAALEQQLDKLIVKQGKAWVANPASQDAHPSEEFLRFLNRMQQTQEALFADGSPQFKMRYSLKPEPEQNVEAVTLDIDGHKFTVARGKPEAQQLSWPGSGQVVVTVRAGGNIPFGSYSGPWAVLRWMYDSDTRSPGGKIAQWSMLRQGHGQPQAPTDAQGHPIVLRVEISEFPSGVDIFDRNFFGVRCPGKAAE
ncbi:MAG TPA: type VI secretion system membrane subunit TssM [Bryobacteraceae bacterium]|nr:type VI secretion system membrane subunit TssM [Bryobacteraceae bacterium]